MTRRSLLLWLTAYVAIMAGITAGLLSARSRTLAALDTSAARAEWQEWRDAAAKQSALGPVHRRVPKSTEPPALTLMRDYFPVMLGGGLFFSTALFILLGWAARGAFRQRS